MAYNLIITEKAEDLLDNLIYHLVYGLKNDQALDFTREEIEEAVEACGFPPSVRGETPSLEQFAALSNVLGKIRRNRK